jgi:hypothetical protein
MMHYWSLLWDWNSIDSVRSVHSVLEGSALIFFALLVLFDVLAHLTEDAQKDRAKGFERVGLCCFAVAVLAEMLAYPYSKRNDELSGNEIHRLSVIGRKALDDANTAITHAGHAETSAGLAEQSSKRAVEKSDRAEGSASSAMTLAKGARKEADTFENRLGSAEHKADEAESHLAEALRRATEATSELDRLRSPRSLTHIPELIFSLAQFKDTEYTFSSVFQDGESIDFLKAIDSVLQHAGWKRVKPPHGFPAINVYGSDVDFAVTVDFNAGVQVSADAPEALTVLQSTPLEKLSQLVRAAIVLNLSLSSNTLPQGNAESKPVDIQVGTSKTIRIAVGKRYK